MNRYRCVLLISLVLLLGAAVYARQWPLRLSTDDAGAYKVALPAEVYRTAADPALRDVDVLDADGHAVPAALMRENHAQVSSRLVDLPWFALPEPVAGAQADDLRVLSERDAQGRVLRVQLQTETASATNTPSPARSWLFDASAIGQPINALLLQWNPPAQPLDIAYRVEGSDDLTQWRVLQNARLVDLARDGQRLLQARITLSGSARYLRLAPLQAAAPAPELRAVQAELNTAAPVAWQWQTRQPSRINGLHYEFDLQGRFPVERVDVELPGNAAGQWRVESRDSDDAVWQLRVGPWTVFRVGTNERSEPQALSIPVRDRYWRLTAEQAGTGTPTLRLGYVPEFMAFIASGKAPYQLVAGSARAHRAPAPIADLFAQLRARRGNQWQPALAAVGESGELAGAQAFAPAPPDWKRWLLWGILAMAALLIAVFAVSLLREQKPDSSSAA